MKKWVKIPPENHPIFLAALPRDPRVTTLKMFGGVAAKVRGNMIAGTFARSFMVKLSDTDAREALALDGAEPFDPLGNGRSMANTVLMPEATFDDPSELRSWLVRAIAYGATLPIKAAKGTQPKKAKKAKQPQAKQAPAKSRATGKVPRNRAAKKR